MVKISPYWTLIIGCEHHRVGWIILSPNLKNRGFTGIPSSWRMMIPNVFGWSTRSLAATTLSSPSDLRRVRFMPFGPTSPPATWRPRTGSRSRRRRRSWLHCWTCRQLLAMAVKPWMAMYDLRVGLTWFNQAENWLNQQKLEFHLIWHDLTRGNVRLITQSNRNWVYPPENVRITRQKLGFHQEKWWGLAEKGGVNCQLLGNSDGFFGMESARHQLEDPLISPSKELYSWGLEDHVPLKMADS